MRCTNEIGRYKKRVRTQKCLLLLFPGNVFHLRLRRGKRRTEKLRDLGFLSYTTYTLYFDIDSTFVAICHEYLKVNANEKRYKSDKTRAFPQNPRKNPPGFFSTRERRTMTTGSFSRSSSLVFFPFPAA